MTNTHEKVVLSIDAMSGDNDPAAAINGCALALEKNPNLEFLIFGDQEKVTPLLKKHPKLQKVSTLTHTDEIVTGDIKPAQALRFMRGSSMRLAINAVGDGKAHAVVSSGNTGAYMAMSKFVLKTISGIHRPAIATLIPTIKKPTMMLDLGANTECTSENLVQFAVMGKIFAKYLQNIENPKVGLLNIGTENQKGGAVLHTASDVIQRFAKDVNYIGFVEGDDISKGETDVIVTDGFTGNVALKTAEGIVRLMTHLIAESYKHSWATKIAYLLMKRALKDLKLNIDPKHHNGALFLGLNGIAVKSHGNTDEIGFSCAVNVALNMVKKDVFRQEIADEIKTIEAARDKASDGEEIPTNGV